MNDLFHAFEVAPKGRLTQQMGFDDCHLGPLFLDQSLEAPAAETWKQIAGFEGLYEVSDFGRVRSLDRCVKQINRHGTTTDHLYPGKIRALTVAKQKDGYVSVSVSLYSGNCRKEVRVSNLVAAAFLGPRPDGHQVAHNDGNSMNNRLGNLRYDTPRGNAADKVAHGTQMRGERHPAAILSDAEVIEIKRLAGEITQQQIAEKFGVSQSHISAIVTGKKRAAGNA